MIAAVTFAAVATLQISDQTEQFVDSSRPGAMRAGISLTPVSCGTQRGILPQGVPAAILPAACHQGWQQSREQLALPVESEIPD